MKINSLLFSGLFLLVSSFYFQSCISEASANVPIKTTSSTGWTSLEDAVKLAETDHKRILVDVYTDWCKWCKVMDEKTFSDAKMSAYLTENYHLAKFNAEDKSMIRFKGQDYTWAPNGKRGYNELATELLDGQLAYPSLVVFDSKLNKIEVIRGYKSANELISLLEKAG